MFLQAIASFISTAGFAVIFNIPRREIVFSAITGMLGWLTYILLRNDGTSVMIASFVGALVVGLAGEIMARFRKQPGTLFVVPGIIPLVPGYGLYHAMSQVIENNYEQAAKIGTDTLLIAVAIASGVIITSYLGRILKYFIVTRKSPLRMKLKRKKKVI